MLNAATPTVRLIVNRFQHTVGRITQRTPQGKVTVQHTGHEPVELTSLGAAKSLLSLRGEFDVVEFDPSLN